MANGPLLIENSDDTFFNLRHDNKVQTDSSNQDSFSPPVPGSTVHQDSTNMKPEADETPRGASETGNVTGVGAQQHGTTAKLASSDDTSNNDVPKPTSTNRSIDNVKNEIRSDASITEPVAAKLSVTSPAPSATDDSNSVTSGPNNLKDTDPAKWASEERKRKKKKYKYLCKFNNKCVKIAKAGGYCIAHGGGKRCVLPGCEKVARYIGSRCHIHRDLRVSSGTGLGGYRDGAQGYAATGFPRGYPGHPVAAQQQQQRSNASFSGGHAAYQQQASNQRPYMQAGNPYQQLNSGSYGPGPSYYSDHSLNIPMSQQYSRQQHPQSRQAPEGTLRQQSNQRPQQHQQQQRHQQHSNNYLNSMIGSGAPHVLPTSNHSQMLDGSGMMENLTSSAAARKRSTSGLGLIESGASYFDPMQLPNSVGNSKTASGMMSYGAESNKRVRSNQGSDASIGDRHGISSLLNTPPLPMGAYGGSNTGSGGALHNSQYHAAASVPSLFTHRVERILDARRSHSGNGLEFLVQWKDFGPEYNSWQAQEKFVDDSAIRQYYSRGTAAS